MSLKLLLDENIPPQVATELRQLDYDAIHLRDVGLKGKGDKEVIAYAIKTGRCLVTLDADFADIRHHPVGTHSGIIRLRLGLATSHIVISVLRSLLPKLAHVSMGSGILVVSDGKRYRIRFPKDTQKT